MGWVGEGSGKGLRWDVNGWGVREGVEVEREWVGGQERG